MEHDGTLPWSRDYETAALYYYYKKIIYIKYLIFCCKNNKIGVSVDLVNRHPDSFEIPLAGDGLLSVVDRKSP